MPRRGSGLAYDRGPALGIARATLSGVSIVHSPRFAVAHMPGRPTPEQALQRLLEGNRRFTVGAAPQADVSAARRAELAAGQAPFAALVSCADSRVPPEIVFDRGLGDLFVCRVAGNIADIGVVGSVEYAVGVLGVPLIFVLGHEGCGAVKAAVDAVTKGGSVSPNVDVIIDGIRVAVERVRDQPGDLLDNAIRENVRLGMRRLAAEPDIAPFVQDGRIAIAGGVYRLASGVVELVR